MKKSNFCFLLQGGGGMGIKREMLQQRNDSFWTGMIPVWWADQSPASWCKEDSQSQCSVHKLPWCLSLSWATKAVKHSSLQYAWIPLSGTSWDETPEEKICTLKTLQEWGTLLIQYLTTGAAEGSVYWVFLCISVVKCLQTKSHVDSSFLLQQERDHVLLYKLYMYKDSSQNETSVLVIKGTYSTRHELKTG